MGKILEPLLLEPELSDLLAQQIDVSQIAHAVAPSVSGHRSVTMPQNGIAECELGHLWADRLTGPQQPATAPSRCSDREALLGRGHEGDRRADHTYMTSAFVDEAEAMVAALVAKGIPGKLRPGRSCIYAPLSFPEIRERRAERGAEPSALAFATSGWWVRSKRPTGHTVPVKCLICNRCVLCLPAALQPHC